MITTEQRIKRVVYDVLGAYLYDPDNSDDIKKSYSFYADFHADSLDHLELVIALEEEFGTEIPDEVAERFKTVGDVVGYFEGRG